MTRRLLLALIVGTCAGCGVFNDLQSDRFSSNNSAGRAWLSDQIFPPEIVVHGNWKSDTWGRASLYQTGNEVRGNLGDYSVEGVVSGKKVYLLASEGGWFYYSIILEMPVENVLIGYYSRNVPYHTAGRSAMRMERR